MKKNICVLVGVVVAIAIYWLGFVNGIYHNETKNEMSTEDVRPLSDMEALNKYVEEHYDTGCYAEVFMVKNNYVYYDVYSADGELRNTLCTTHKSCLDEYYTY